MKQIVLEHLDETTLASLSELAKLNRLSIEEQAEKILAEAVDMRAPAPTARGKRRPHRGDDSQGRPPDRQRRPAP